MSNVIEFVSGERKVMFNKDNVALYAAVLSSLQGKSYGLGRHGVLKCANVAKVLQANKIMKETDQVNEIGKAFTNLQAKDLVMLTGDKVQTAIFNKENEDMAKQVIEAGEKIELPAVTQAKRGRPAGSNPTTNTAKGKNNTVARNPVVVKGKRFYLVDGKVTPFGVGKPNKDKLLAECDENGKNIADKAAIEARFAQQGSNMAKVKRNPTEVGKPKRFYLKDGKVTPFGLGKPGYDKLANECTQAGEKIDNSAAVAALRQPKATSTGGNTSKISALEAQITQMTEMMKVMQQMMMGGMVPQIPQPVQQVVVPVEVAQAAKVEPVQVAEKTEKTPVADAAAAVRALVADKPAKTAKAKEKTTKTAKPTKAKAKVQADDDVGDEDAYANFANIAKDLTDDDPVAFDSNGFVVTDLD
jgi:hypothetical protein